MKQLINAKKNVLSNHTPKKTGYNFGETLKKSLETSGINYDNVLKSYFWIKVNTMNQP